MVAFLVLWVSSGLAAATLCGGLILVRWLPGDRADPEPPADRRTPPADGAGDPGVAGRSFTAEWLDLAPELAEALRWATPAARRRGVVLATAVESGLALRTNRSALRAALAALLDQAIAVAAGGKVLLAARREGWMIELAVLDDGPGADPAGRRGALRAVDSAIALQGGSLEITAIPGEGTTVRLRLAAPPAAWPQAAATPDATRAAPMPVAAG